MLRLPTVSVLQAKLQALGESLPEGPVRVDGFGDSAELSEQLLGLIIAGTKRAGTSLLWAMEAEGEELPFVGQIEIVVDHRNEPALITRIRSVDVCPFSDVTAQYAELEGEGDKSLGYWQEGHWAFFSRECASIGKEPSRSMPVVCTVFEVLNVLPRPTV